MANPYNPTMPGEEDPPSMGSTYQNLINLTTPRMMPEAPVGAGGMAGAMYGSDQARQDDIIRRATQLAQLDAQMRAEQAGEFSQLGPARQAEIAVKNAMAQNTQANLPSITGAATADYQTKALTAGTNKNQAEIDKLKPYAREWNAAKTDEEKEAIRQDMVQSIGKIGTRNLADVPLDRLDETMKRTFQSEVMTPKQAGQERIENLKGGVKLGVAEITGNARTDSASILAAARERVAMAAAQGRKRDIVGEMYQTVLDSVGGDRNKAYNIWQNQEMQKTVARAQAMNPPTQYEVQFPKDSMVQARPPVPPKPVQLPENNEPVPPPSPKFREGQVYTDAKGNKARYENGKFVPIQ